MKKTLVVKNFSGSFNDEFIGQEVINSFDYDNNNSEYYLFFLPPYGSIFSETNFFSNKDYREGFEKIVIFEETGITNVLKLKAVALYPESIDENTYKNLVKKVRFKGKKFQNIKFGTDSYYDPLDGANIFNVTYLIKKSLYYKLEKFNILIWHKSTAIRNELIGKSKERVERLYGKKLNKFELLDDTTIGQKNYCYNVGPKFETWFDAEVRPLLNDENRWQLQTVAEQSAGLKKYDDNNLIANLHRTGDENLYTNFIQTVLLQNNELLKNFFAYLVDKRFGKKGYKPTDSLLSETQKQSLIELKRAANSFILRDGHERHKKMEELIKKCSDTGIADDVRLHIKQKKKFENGYIDLYFEDDNYRIAIENKIYSGINGRHKDSEDWDQIKKYQNYFEDLNRIKVKKQYNVVIIAPESEKNNFKNYGADDVISYKELYDFFSKNKGLIKRKNRDDFLNALAFHALTKEEIVTSRFLRVLS